MKKYVRLTIMMPLILLTLALIIAMLPLFLIIFTLQVVVEMVGIGAIAGLAWLNKKLGGQNPPMEYEGVLVNFRC